MDDLQQRASRFPLGAGTTREDLAAPGREHRLDLLREHEPVTWVPALEGWLVTSRETARQVLSPSAATTVESPHNPVAATLGRTMLSVDGLEHRRLRQPFDRSFTRREVHHHYESIVDEVTRDLIDGMVEQGGGELTSDFAVPFSIRVAARILGIGLSDTAAVEHIYARLAAAMSYGTDPQLHVHAASARRELDELLRPEVDRVRRTPGVAHTPDHQPLSDPEILAQLRVILFGAIETIQSSVLGSVLLLLTHPDQLAAARAATGGWVAAVDESLRLIPPVAFIERWAARDMELGGVTVRAGELVGISVVAANRDPAAFPDPDVFDVSRANAARGLSFAFGPHTCLGAQLARVQTAVAVEALLTRLSGLRLVASGPVSGFTFRRPAFLHVEWTPGRSAALTPAGT